MSTSSEPTADRLFDLLPVIHKMRDAEQGYPLKALLRVIAEQVNVVEADIDQLYRNWFIETAEDWVVPYLGELIGYRPVIVAGNPDGLLDPAEERLNRVLTPRREVANTIRYRRRKGTLALLELLARDVADWPARAVEFFKLLGWNQNLNHLHLERASLVDVRRMSELELVDGPFDITAHTVDVRRPNSARTLGRHNVPSVGVFVWRLKPYSVTRTPAYCAEGVAPNLWTFSVLGNDAPLYTSPATQEDPSQIAAELDLPTPIRRRGLEENLTSYYPGPSLSIWAEGWAGLAKNQPVPAEAIVAADLSGWKYIPEKGKVAVDPVLGRFAFPPRQLPKKGVQVSYHYGFSADMGGGEYDRKLSEPASRWGTSSEGPSEQITPAYFKVGEGQPHRSLGSALRKWEKDAPVGAVIEITDSGVYVEPIAIELDPDQVLQIRAANGVRPVVRLLDWQTDAPDALVVTLGQGSRFVLDGLMVTGRAVHFQGAEAGEDSPQPEHDCLAEIVIRHCTLVPGWGIGPKCEPKRPSEPSLELYKVGARVSIEKSILGSIQVYEDEVRADPIPLCVSDSIVDATDSRREAIGAAGEGVAHAVLTVRRSTVFGSIEVHAMELGEDSIFMDCINVARRQIGCVRFSYVKPGCRTPKRYRCQPDLVVEKTRTIADPAERARMVASEPVRVVPQFTAVRYGNPAYAQLALTCAREISTGASDQSEMGVFHDLFQPQRRTNLETRLNEYTPAGMNVGIFYAN